MRDFHDYLEEIMVVIATARKKLSTEQWEYFVDDLVDALTDQDII